MVSINLHAKLITLCKGKSPYRKGKQSGPKEFSFVTADRVFPAFQLCLRLQKEGKKQLMISHQCALSNRLLLLKWQSAAHTSCSLIELI